MMSKKYIENTEEGTYHKGKCKGIVTRDHRLSKLEKFLGHRKYTCTDCLKSWKYGIKNNEYM